MEDQRFYNVVAIVAAGEVLLAFAAGYLGAQWGGQSPYGSPGGVTSGPDYLYLTASVNPVTGWPQYTTGNFTVHRGAVVVTITDYDSPTAWPGCACNVTGTEGGVEGVNGIPMSEVPTGNVAHTFTISASGPGLHLNVLSPGRSTVTFTVWLNETGSFGWFCTAPCGTNGYIGGAMSTPGYMFGTMTVV